MAEVIEMKKPEIHEMKIIVVTPEMAVKILEQNKCNRPISQQHVNRIARQIKDGRWRFNGETIKISTSAEILDGQHRLWAIIESGIPVSTVIIYDIAPDAFATIDAISRPRTGADILALTGMSRHRQTVSGGLTWLIRYQRESIRKFRAPENRVENSDIEASNAAHPQMIEAAERVKHCRRVMNLGIAAFLYYIFSNKDADLADKFVDAIENPAGMSTSHPFFLYREWLLNQKLLKTHRDPVVVIALGMKAWNAAHDGKRPKSLSWRSSGTSPEAFPKI